jgi:hypothetical protein
MTSLAISINDLPTGSVELVFVMYTEIINIIYKNGLYNHLLLIKIDMTIFLLQL